LATPTDPGAPSGPPDPPNVPAPAPLGPLPPGGSLIGIIQLTDAGTVRIAQLKAAATAAVAGDPSLVVALSPNSPVPPGANAIGSVSLNTQLPSGSNVIGAVNFNQPLPAGTNLIGKIEISQQKTLKTVKVDVAALGSTVLVALVAAKRLKVYAFSLQAKAAVDVKLLDGVTDLTGAWSFGVREGIALACDPPAFLMATTAGAALSINLSAAVQVVGWVSYWDDDAT
jgi:hypothetical protein